MVLQSRPIFLTERVNMNLSTDPTGLLPGADATEAEECLLCGSEGNHRIEDSPLCEDCIALINASVCRQSIPLLPHGPRLD
jgi:hypothetical protein